MKPSRRLPALNPEGVIGAVSYSDGQFDDAGFNLALVRTFTEAGGIGVNRASGGCVYLRGGRKA